MATLILGSVGATLGAAAGGLAGAVLAGVGAFAGSRAGAAIDRAIFGSPGRTREGPRLGDLAVQSSAYGEAIPLLYGTMRAAGNVIWSTGLIERRHEESQKVRGGKGGGSTRVTNITYTYSASFAVALSAREIVGIGRIWADGKLLRDNAGRLAVDGRLRIHHGGEDQAPDPLILARSGAGGTPAYRGLAYVVFEELQLAEYANRIPNITVEVIADPGGSVALSAVVADICGRAGLEAIDVSALADIEVRGFAVARVMSCREALEALAEVYQFDAVEREGVLVFAPLARETAMVIQPRDLVRREREGDVLRWSRVPEGELPREVAVRHLDPARDYQPGLQRARRLATQSPVMDTRDYALVLDAAEAKRAAEAALARTWRERLGASFALPAKFAALAPGDVVEIAGDEGDVLMLRRVEFADGILECEAVAYAGDRTGAAEDADPGALPPQEIPDVAATDLHLLNLPALLDGHGTAAGFYVAMTSGDPAWRGAVLLRSADGGASYDIVAQGASPAVAGTTLTALPPGPADFWDEGNALVVELLSGGMELESRPELAILNGANAALVGDEILQFREAELQFDGSWRLKGLLRGRRGTERHMDHPAGERFILLEPWSVLLVETGASSIGRPDLYKCVSVGDVVENATALTFAATGENLRPLAPVHLAGRRDGAGNLHVRWIRRARTGGDWIDHADVPLGEERELYEVEILDDAEVRRRVTVDAPAFTYDAAMQAADFGMTPASVAVRVRQVSAAVGPGHAAEALL